MAARAAALEQNDVTAPPADGVDVSGGTAGKMQPLRHCDESLIAEWLPASRPYSASRSLLMSVCVVEWNSLPPERSHRWAERCAGHVIGTPRQRAAKAGRLSSTYYGCRGLLFGFPLMLLLHPLCE